MQVRSLDGSIRLPGLDGPVNGLVLLDRLGRVTADAPDSDDARLALQPKRLSNCRDKEEDKEEVVRGGSHTEVEVVVARLAFRVVAAKVAVPAGLHGGLEDGRRKIISDPPLIVPVEQLASHLDVEAAYRFLRGLLADYTRTLPAHRRRLAERFTLTGLARKVVGVGSVGTETWIMLTEPDDGLDPLLLKAKQAQRSVLADYAGASHYRNQGERVVAGQHLMQAVSDISLGWQSATPPGRRSSDFYVRQLRDWKYSVEITRMTVAAMTGYGRMCGWTLARAHARAGDQIAIAAYLGDSDAFDRAVTDFAETYADQTERDHVALADAVASGRVQAQAGI
jgi:Uncharacterized protein conserved in bacteria (DUF2252)